jgi:HK97 gp10 family phage protein
VSDGASLDLSGLQAFIDEMKELPKVLQQRVMRGAVATGASVVRKASISAAPEWTGQVGSKHPPPGTLKQAIFQSRVVDQCTDTVEIWKVDVRSEDRELKSGTRPGAYYAHMVEFGHYTRGSKKVGGTKKSRRERQLSFGQVRWIAPQPFMRPAFDANQQAALDAMQQYIANNLPAAVGAMRYIRAIGG